MTPLLTLLLAVVTFVDYSYLVIAVYIVAEPFGGLHHLSVLNIHLYCYLSLFFLLLLQLFTGDFISLLRGSGRQSIGTPIDTV